MKTVGIYAVCISSIFAAFFVLAFRSSIWQLVEYVALLLRKVLIYPRILHRHSSLGPWTPAGLIVQAAYITANVYCLEFWKLTATNVGIRAANLALINMTTLPWSASELSRRSICCLPEDVPDGSPLGRHDVFGSCPLPRSRRGCSWCWDFFSERARGPPWTNRNLSRPLKSHK